MRDNRLLEIQRREDAASPGPWQWWDIKDSGSGGTHESLVQWGGIDSSIQQEGRLWGLSNYHEFDTNEAVLVLDGPGPLLTQDADFIASARVDIPFLMREVMELEERCRSEREAAARYLESQISAWRDFPRVQAVLKSSANGIRQGRHLPDSLRR
jgi:hypothetical protein